MTWVGFSSASEDGFYHRTPCTPFATSKQVEITTAGFSGTCMVISGGSVTFTYPDSVVNSHQDPPGVYDRQP